MKFSPKTLLVLIFLMSTVFSSCQKDIIHPDVLESQISQNEELVQNSKGAAVDDYILFPTFHFEQQEQGLSVQFIDQSNATGIVIDGCEMGFFVTATFVSFEDDTIDHKWTLFEVAGEDVNGGTYAPKNGKYSHLFSYPKTWESVVIHVGSFAGHCMIIPEESAIGVYYNGESMTYGCLPNYEDGPEFCNGYPIGFTVPKESGELGAGIEGLKEIEVVEFKSTIGYEIN